MKCCKSKPALLYCSFIFLKFTKSRGAIVPICSKYNPASMQVLLKGQTCPTSPVANIHTIDKYLIQPHLKEEKKSGKISLQSDTVHCDTWSLNKQKLLNLSSKLSTHRNVGLTTHPDGRRGENADAVQRESARARVRPTSWLHGVKQAQGEEEHLVPLITEGE